MSQKREKERRAKLKADYEQELYWWYRCEPSKLLFISHWRWKRKKPVFNHKANK